MWLPMQRQKTWRPRTECIGVPATYPTDVASYGHLGVHYHTTHTPHSTHNTILYPRHTSCTDCTDFAMSSLYTDCTQPKGLDTNKVPGQKIQQAQATMEQLRKRQREPIEMLVQSAVDIPDLCIESQLHTL